MGGGDVGTRRSRIMLLVAMILMATMTVRAQEAPVTPSVAPAAQAQNPAPNTVPRAKIVVRPVMSGVTKAFSESGLKDARTVAWVDYDAEGTVRHAELSGTTGNAALDAEIIAWVLAAKMEPGTAGRGSIPFSLKDEVSLDDIPEARVHNDFVKRPSMTTLQEVFAHSGESRYETTVVMNVSEDGKVLEAMVTTPAPRISARGKIDATVVAWAKQLKFKPGITGLRKLYVSMEIH